MNEISIAGKREKVKPRVPFSPAMRKARGIKRPERKSLRPRLQTKSYSPPEGGRIALSANERIAEFLDFAIQAKFAYVNKLSRRENLSGQKNGLQFAVQDGVDHDMADGEVVLHRGGEDVGGFNAGLGREGIYEVRIPQALRGSAVHEHIFFIEIPPRFCLVKVCFTTWPYYTHFYVKNQAKMNFLNKQNSNMAEFIRK